MAWGDVLLINRWCSLMFGPPIQRQTYMHAAKVLLNIKQRERYMEYLLHRLLPPPMKPHFHVRRYYYHPTLTMNPEQSHERGHCPCLPCLSLLASYQYPYQPINKNMIDYYHTYRINQPMKNRKYIILHWILVLYRICNTIYTEILLRLIMMQFIRADSSSRP